MELFKEIFNNGGHGDAEKAASGNTSGLTASAKTDKAKPAARRGRKATGLKDRGAAGRARTRQPGCL